MSKKVCVLGLGYIGLPTALLLAEAGHNVFGVDTNESIVESLKNGKITINEPGLDILLQAWPKAFPKYDVQLIIKDNPTIYGKNERLF